MSVLIKHCINRFNELQITEKHLNRKTLVTPVLGPFDLPFTPACPFTAHAIKRKTCIYRSQSGPIVFVFADSYYVEEDPKKEHWPAWCQYRTVRIPQEHVKQFMATTFHNIFDHTEIRSLILCIGRTVVRNE